MPRLKADDLDFDIDELENAEFSDRGFASYDGPQPPANTTLSGLVTKAWWTYTKNDDRMITLIFTAADNVGDEEQYNGCEIWDYIPFSAGAKFRWKPFIDAFGLTLQDLKTKSYAAPEDDSIGAPIEKVAGWTPGEDSAYAMILTARSKFDGEWRTKVARWMEYQEPGSEEADTDADTDAGDEEEIEVEVEEETPAPRGRRAPAKAEAAPAKAPATRGARSAPATAKAQAKPAARGRRPAAADVDEEPPF